jgi:leucyl aminopeptidase
LIFNEIDLPQELLAPALSLRIEIGSLLKNMGGYDVKFLVEQGDIAEITTDAIVLGVFKNIKKTGGAADIVDKKLDGAISELLEDGDFQGKKNDTCLMRSNGRLHAKRILLVGLGDIRKFSLDTVREASAVAAKACAKFSDIAMIAHGAGIGRLKTEEAAQALVEGILLGAYKFSKYRTTTNHNGEPTKLETVRVVEIDPAERSQLKVGLDRGQKIGNAVCAARDLANEPGLTLTPKELARRAEAMSKFVGLSCTILDERKLEKEAMGGILGVARGSDEPPRFIILEHNAGAKKKGTIVLVGKGVTFDSGGYSLKAREGMGEMKFDMSGAAAVFGAMQAIATLALPLHVVGLISACENLVNGKALKPGDVITMLGGKTVEVMNTDAEGRLVLGDALVFAERYRPKVVIDLATLTGACVTALGKEAAGLFCNDTALAKQLQSASEVTGERIWPLPLYDEYRDILKSETADMMNSNLRVAQAGACVGAIFLKEFVNYPWAHLDIAGTAYHVDSRKYNPRGATGFGVRLLVEMLSQSLKRK